ncbi:MAG: hypothetical protein LW850_27155 [Planctomycetaceae bacterium]|jgi:hypothetical protein|nr:hypothetical protein [Planctomycetaceae bacterium]
MTTPPILEEVRRVRHEISAEVGHDPKRLREYYSKIQKSVRSRTINLADQGPYGRTKDCTEADDQPTSDGNSIRRHR